MERFIKLRENNATSKKRVEYESVYEDMMVNERFSNAWQQSNEAEASAYESYDDFIYEEEEEDGEDEYEDIVILSDQPSSLPLPPAPSRAVPEAPTSLPLPPPPDLDEVPVYSTVTKEWPVSLGSLVNKRASLPRNSLVNRLASLGGDARKSQSLPRSSRPVLKDVKNPLFTPSPVGSPARSSPLSERLAAEEMEEEDAIYDTPAALTIQEPPILPPKKKSLSLKLKTSFERSNSSPDTSSDGSATRQQRHLNRFASVDQSRARGSRGHGEEDDQSVGSLIARSSKSDKLEKRMSKKGRETVENSDKRRSPNLPTVPLETEEEKLRKASLALRDDWCEIDNIMAELQMDIVTAQSQRRISSNVNRKKEQTLSAWLEGLEMTELKPMLELNGWDHVDHIKGAMAREDVAALGITNEKVKRKLLDSVEGDLISYQHGAVPGTVEEWLREINLTRYLSKFTAQRIGCMSRVLAIWEIELTTILGIEPIGHRKRMMKSIRDLKSLQRSLDQAEKNKKRTPGGGATKESAGPTQFHTRAELERGVDYEVRYLGCSKIEGTGNTRETSGICNRLLEKTKGGEQKVPEYRLRISAEGIGFIDKVSQRSTCSYPIQDISFVSRDKGNLLVFSFITTDRKLGIKMCHVLKALTRNQAYETCATIAQSFEVAYQMKKEMKLVS